VRISGNIDDLEAKLAKAKRDLKNAPKSQQAKIKGDISQLEAQIRKAKADLASVQGKTIGINIVTTHNANGSVTAHEGGRYKAAGGRIVGPGTGTSDDVPIWASNGEYVVNAKSARKYGTLLDAINGGSMRAYASGGRVSSSEKQARSEALGDLTQTYFGYKLHSKAAFQAGTSNAGSIGELVSTLNDWRTKIKAATRGAQESKLIRAFDKFGTAALRNEQRLEKVNSQLSKASDKLSSLKDAAAQLKDSVSSGIVSGGSIAKAGGANALGVLEQLQGSVNDAQRFAGDLARLKKAGLNSQSLSELAQAGVEGGLATADALAGGSGDYIKKINALEKQLQAAGGAAGKTAADSAYGAGIATAQALVTGLRKQQASINKIMANAANAMARELKHELGKKASGGVVGAAAAGGNRWGRTLVGEYGPEIADLPVGTRVHSAPDTARMLTGGGDSRPIDLTVIIGGAQVGAALIDPLRGEIRNRGGNVQVVLGQRGA
jgi:hypothetical protein